MAAFTPDPSTATSTPAACLVRVLVALDLRLDRETTSRAMALLRPEWCVRAVEPAALDAEIAARHPQAVVCSALTATLVERVPVWFMAHAAEPSRYAASIDGAEAATDDLGFYDILDLIDRRAG